MAEQRMKVRDKKVQKMTKDGLVEENLTEKSSVRVSSRTSDVQMGKKGKDDLNFADKSPVEAEKRGKNVRSSVQNSRDAPATTRAEQQTAQESRKQRNQRMVRRESGKVAREKENSTTESGRLKEKQVELSQSRGDSRRKQNGGSKKPKQKQRLQFAYEETGASVKGEKETEKFNQMDADGVNFRKQNQKERADKLSDEEAQKKTAPKKHSRKEKVYQEHADENVGKKKSRLKFGSEESDSEKKAEVLKKAGGVASAALHREIRKNEDDNAAVEGTHKLEEGAEGAYRLEQKSARWRKQRTAQKRSSLERQAAQKQEQKKLKKLIQKQRIKRDYAKAKHSEQAAGTAAKGTIDYIKKIGGKVTNFFKENRKVYVSVALLIGLMMLIMTNVTSCSSLFLQNLITYTGTSYLSSDEAIREAELYYTQLEANLQERINNMESEEPGHEEYRYNIGPIEHDPFVLISYLSAKYEEFTFEQVKPELDALFALQYHLETEAVNETVTETTTVRVGESLGQVVTSGYCNCPICCGVWSGGPTASGAYPTANHTLAVDASDPFVPMGTKVVMNGVEYTVEDTGAFARYGVQFDVYYDNHAAASAHGHQTWECYLADDNGSQEVEVTRTRKVDVLNVTLNSGNLMSICQDRLGFFQKELFSAYNDTKGNLQMFATPVEFNWYSSVTSYYGYRIHPISGANQLHNGMDIGAPEGSKVMAGLTGTVVTSAYNDSYGNYVVIKDSKGYELRYAHLSSRSVSAGSAVTKGDEIGLVGSTGNSTGSHLHVELLKHGERLNPIFYLETGEGSIFGGNEYTSEAAQRLLEEAARYLGTPYVWGGYSPSGFDCSGFVSYCLTNSGVRNTGRLTAQGLYDICTPVSQSDAQPGDLIFFTGTYDAGVPVTHIGIYVGNGQMIHCGHPVQYTSINSPYWQSHFYGFGRW